MMRQWSKRRGSDWKESEFEASHPVLRATSGWGLYPNTGFRIVRGGE